MTFGELRAALLSTAFNLYTLVVVVLTFAASDGATHTFGTFTMWLSVHWWQLLVSLIVNPGPFFRARQVRLNGKAH